MESHGRTSAITLLPSGLRVGSRYVVESVIGEGASGVVYLARREPENERVALKVIHRHLCTDEQVYKRFRREAEILKRLEGPHLVRLHELFEEDGLLFIALEYIEGTSLEMWLKESPPDVDQAVELSLQICAALGAAHAAGVVHRDLKPANVLIERLTRRSTGLRVRVVDFGLAKMVLGDGAGTALTQRDMIFGTPEYMAPEQARGEEVDLRCDLFAAGVMLYEMLTGAVPWRGRTPFATMNALLTQELPQAPVSTAGRPIAPSLMAVLLRALAKRPEERFPSARAFAEALTGAFQQRHVIAPHVIEDPDTLGTTDTDLHVSTEGLRPEAPVSSGRSAPGNAPVAPISGNPISGNPISGNPISANPISANPISANPISAKPISGQPISAKPISGNPISGNPISAKPISGNPISGPRSNPELLAPHSGPLSIEGAETPRPGGLLFWIAAIVTAVICVVIGVLIGTR